MADITSANVVGYTTTGLAQGAGKFSMIGLTFNNAAGENLQLNGGLKVENATGTDDSGTSDHLKLWDPTRAGGAGGYLTFWFYDDGEESGWCDPDGNYVEDGDYADGFPAGTAFWYEAIDAKEKSFSVSGGVEGADYIEPPLASGKQFSMFADPYPVTLQLNSDHLVCSGLTGTDDSGTSDHLKLWDATRAGGAGGYLTFWFYDDGAESGWCDPEGNYVEDGEYADGFAPGTPFWLEPIDAKAKTLRFVNPITK